MHGVTRGAQRIGERGDVGRQALRVVEDDDLGHLALDTTQPQSGVDDARGVGSGLGTTSDGRKVMRRTLLPTIAVAIAVSGATAGHRDGG